MLTLRSLGKAPAFTLLAVLVMALGIAAITALFSVVDAVLLEPLAFPDPGRVVAINTAWPAKDKTSLRVTGGDFLDLRAAARDFSAIAFYSGGEIGVRLQDRALFAQTFWADPSFFDVLAIRPALGRLPTLEDAGRTAILTTSFARSHWTTTASALGQVLRVDNKPYLVTGLVEDRLAFPEKTDIWITADPNPENQNRSAFNYRAIARVKPAISLGEAQAELATLGARFEAAHPESNKGKIFRVNPLQDQLSAPVRTTLYVLFAAAGLLLLISCANVANLMLTRAAVRQREMAVRLSLGAGPRGIVSLLLREGLVLAGGAALAGISLAFLALRALHPFLPSSLPLVGQGLRVNPAVLLFAAAVSALTVIACSLVPAFHLRKVDIADVLKRSPGRGFMGGAARPQRFIVVAQIAISCVLCVGAALLARTLVSLIETPLGFRAEGVLVMYADAPAFELPQYLAAIRTFETALAQIERIPGVRSAAATMGLPTGQYGSNGNYLVEGVNIQPGQDPFKINWPNDTPWAIFALASPRYFETLGIRLDAGRDFSARDQYDAPFSAIISESLARQSFGSSNPLGRRIYCGLDSPKPMTIVGVVSDVRQDSPSSKPEPAIYMPFQQHPYHANELQLIVRSSAGDPASLMPEVRRRMTRLSPFIATRFTTLTQMVEDSMESPRFRAALALAFAFLALALAMAGVYGVMSYLVNERRAEMGLRMALGANRISIIGLVVRQAGWLALVGLAIGVAGAAAMSKAAASLLYGVRPFDAPTYLIGVGALLAVILAAAAIPSWRASRVDPAVVLRSD